TDDGVRELAALTQLTTLQLDGTPVTDVAADELTRLTSLTTLGLPAAAVTDRTLRVLAKANLLVALDRVRAAQGRPAKPGEAGAVYLVRTPVTDAGLKPILGFKNLGVLDLTHTR